MRPNTSFGDRTSGTSLISKFISPEVSVINFLANLRVFLVGLGNSIEFLSSFIEVSEEI